MLKSTGSYRIYSIPGKTAALIPEFAVEDLSSAELQPRFPRFRCRGVSGILARGTRDVSPAVSRRFPMVLGGTAGAKCARVSSVDAVRATTAARTMRRS